MSIHLYILEGGLPKQVSVAEWGAWQDDPEHTRIKHTRMGEVLVSTVFIGVGFSDCLASATLFETAVFGGKLDGTQVRDATGNAALATHRALVRRIKGE